MGLTLAVCLGYLVYRAQYTLNLEGAYATFASLLLYGAEVFGCFSLLLFFLQVWDVREPAEEPILENRTVDVLVPTYNEDVQLLRATLQACVNLEYPHQTYVLDDGHRDEVRELAEELGVRYISRDSNLHAKAGNLNNALEQTEGDFVCIFDADHIPLPHFITRMIGYFRDEKVGMIQSPHAFYNFDNFAGSFDAEKRRYWDEGQLFYNVIQPGKNRWNAVVFAGSAAMFRRNALRDVGYIATETITEDMHTGLRMNAAGWKSFYISERLISGQAAPDVTTFHSQRLRWGEGNLSILFHDNPLTMRGLRMPQRLSYFGSIIHWAGGFANLAIYLTPILLLFTGVAPVSEFNLPLGIALATYLLMTHMSLKMASQGFGRIMEIQLFSMASFWTQIRSTLRALFSRREQKFVVTSKRGRQAGSILPYIMPQIAIIAVGFLSLAWGGYRLFFGTSKDLVGPAIAAPLVAFHIYLAWVVVRRALKAENQRFAYRHMGVVPLTFRFQDADRDEAIGHGVTADLNEYGLSLIAYQPLLVGSNGELTLSAPGEPSLTIKAEIRHVDRSELVTNEHGTDKGLASCYRYGVQFHELTPEQTDALVRISQHYTIPRLVEDFQGHRTALQRLGARLRGGLQWSKREPRFDYKLPLAMAPAATGAGAGVATDPSVAVTEDISRSAFRVLLAEEHAEGSLFDFSLSSPVGDIAGRARVMRLEARQIGPRRMFEHVLQFVRYEGQGRGIMQSLLAPAGEKRTSQALRAESAPQPVPFFQPVAASVLAAVVLIPASLGFFKTFNNDDLFLQGVLESGAATQAERDRVDRLYHDAVLVHPGTDRVVLLADIMASQGRTAEADTLTRLLLTDQPGDLGLKLSLADSLSAMGRYDEAQAEYEYVLAHTADDSDDNAELIEPALLASARNLVNSEDPAERETRLQSSGEIEPSAAYSARLRSALGYFDQLLARSPARIDARNECANVLLSLNRLDDALALYDGVRLDNRAHLQLAAIYSAQQDIQAAERECRAVIEVDPTNTEAKLIIANLLVWDKNFAAASSVYSELLADDPANLLYPEKLAELALWRGDYAIALERYQELLEADFAANRLWTGYLDSAAGLLQAEGAALSANNKAILYRMYDAEMETNQLTPMPLARLGMIFKLIGEEQFAVALLERSVALDPSSRENILTLADLYHDMGEFEKADERYRSLLGAVSERSFRPPQY